MHPITGGADSAILLEGSKTVGLSPLHLCVALRQICRRPLFSRTSTSPLTVSASRSEHGRGRKGSHHLVPKNDQSLRGAAAWWLGMVVGVQRC